MQKNNKKFAKKQKIHQINKKIRKKFIKIYDINKKYAKLVLCNTFCLVFYSILHQSNQKTAINSNPHGLVHKISFLNYKLTI